MNHVTQAFCIALALNANTHADIQLLRDFNPGAGHSFSESFVRFEDKVYFDNSFLDANKVFHHGFFKTDGTRQGTERVYDFDQTPFKALTGAIPFKQQLYFLALGSTFKWQLYRTDGSTGNFEKITSLPHGVSNWPSPVVSGGKLYFVADDGIHGWELWVSDGTRHGTRIVKDLALNEKNSGIADLQSMNGRLLFTAAAPIDTTALWVTDGSSEGTAQIHNLGATNHLHATRFDSRSFLFISADKPFIDGYFLYRSNMDGSEKTLLATSPEQFFTDSFKVGKQLYYNLTDTVRQSVWQTGGTRETTGPVPFINRLRKPAILAVEGRRLFLSARDPGRKWALYGAEPALQTTTLLRQNLEFVPPLHVGHVLYFVAKTPEWGSELYESDGTPGGTKRVADLYPGPASSLVRPEYASDDYLLLSARTPKAGFELFVLRQPRSGAVAD